MKKAQSIGFRNGSKISSTIARLLNSTHTQTNAAISWIRTQEGMGCSMIWSGTVQHELATMADCGDVVAALDGPCGVYACLLACLVCFSAVCSSALAGLSCFLSFLICRRLSVVISH